MSRRMRETSGAIKGMGFSREEGGGGVECGVDNRGGADVGFKAVAGGKRRSGSGMTSLNRFGNWRFCLRNLPSAGD
jgi:hypothetical protein